MITFRKDAKVIIARFDVVLKGFNVKKGFIIVTRGKKSYITSGFTCDGFVKMYRSLTNNWQPVWVDINNLPDKARLELSAREQNECIPSYSPEDVKRRVRVTSRATDLDVTLILLKDGTSISQESVSLPLNGGRDTEEKELTSEEFESQLAYWDSVALDDDALSVYEEEV